MNYVGVQFGNSAKVYDYRTFFECERGDYVVTKHSWTGQLGVARVVRVYDDDFIPQEGIEYTWLVQKVDTIEHDRHIIADHEGSGSAQRERL